MDIFAVGNCSSLSIEECTGQNLQQNATQLFDNVQPGQNISYNFLYDVEPGGDFLNPSLWSHSLSIFLTS